MNRPIRAGSALLALALFLSCSSPTGSGSDDAGTSSGDSGSLSISISSISDCLADYLDGASLGPLSMAVDARPMAFLHASSIRIEVKDSSGADLVPPAIRTIGETGASQTETLGSIPVGGPYRVIVGVFNSANASEPVASATKKNVAIEKDKTTEIALSYIPAASQSISAGSGPWSGSIASGGEAWYSSSFVAGTEYTISIVGDGIAAFLFDRDGAYLETVTATSPYTYACASSGTYYIGVAGASGSFSLGMSSYRPPKNEGSADSPVFVALNQARNFCIGTEADSESFSYYYFTSGQAGTHYFSLFSPTYLYGELYSSASFTGSPIATFYGATGGSLGSLSAATTYYLCLKNTAASYYKSLGMIVDPSYIADNGQSDGSASSPQALDLDVDFDGSVGTSSFDCRSYYSFTTGSGNDYLLTISDESGSYLRVEAFSDSGFSTPIDSFIIFSSPCASSLALVAYRTYYVSVTNAEAVNSVEYSLRISPDTVPVIPLALSSLVEGSSSETDQAVWYKANVTPGYSYDFSLLDADSGDDYSLDAKASLYHADKTTRYGDAVGDSDTPITLTIADGESILYIKVSPLVWGDSGDYALRVDPSD